MKFGDDTEMTTGFVDFLTMFAIGINPDIHPGETHNLISDAFDEDADLTEADLEELGTHIRMTVMMPKGVQ